MAPAVLDQHQSNTRFTVSDFLMLLAGVVAVAGFVGYLIGRMVGEKHGAQLLERMRRRYQWATDELLSCDHGDNDVGSGVVGWRVHGWRNKRKPRLILGPTIDDAIDSELKSIGARE
jgi:hypothetical protein